MKDAEFVFVTCQAGAETALKRELARDYPALRLAYSCRGFLTFKVADEASFSLEPGLQAVFARASGIAAGEVVADADDAMADLVWQRLGPRPVRRIHVWSRDRVVPGAHGFEPGPTAETRAIHRLLVERRPAGRKLAETALNPDAPARPGEQVLDCVVLEPRRWWVGHHRATSLAAQWPGGVFPLTLPASAVSRAWLKMEEGLRWSGLPIPADARVCELGSAPGGASQALLARGWHVTGVDPAEMNPLVLGHPRFTHIRKKANQARRREFRKIRWLTADMNVAPQYTLDVIESIVAHPQVNIRGLLLTLKLFEWDLADQLPQFLGRIGGWGYNVIRCRQLVHNRQEVCVAALQQPFQRKPAVVH